MIKIGKKLFVAIGIGVLCALILLLIKLFFMDGYGANEKVSINESVNINDTHTDGKEKLDLVVLKLFDFNLDSYIDKDENAELLTLPGNYQVKIVAQSTVASTIATLIEVSSPKETKRVLVKEGDIVNDLLIKSISEQHIVVENKGKEFIIKLFHPKELNLTEKEINDEKQ